MGQQTKQEELLSQAMDLIVESGADLKTLFNEDGLLKKLTKSLVERALNAELSEHHLPIHVMALAKRSS